MSWRWNDDNPAGWDDGQLLRVVRGINAVDRATSRFRARGLLELKIPTAVAVKLGWPLCASCGRPVVPWQVVQWRLGEWHPSCITAHLSEHGGRREPGTSGGPVHAREAW